MFLLKLLTLWLVVGTECRTDEETMHTMKEMTVEHDQVPYTAEMFYSSSGCFYANRSVCKGQPCQRILNNAMVCCDINSTMLKEGLFSDPDFGNQQILALHVINATLDTLNVSLPTWRRLTSMSFTDGNIKDVLGTFMKNSPAACLNLSNNGLFNITPRAFVNLFNLTILDISNNSLVSMPHFNRQGRDLHLDFKGNNAMLCKNVLDALAKTSGNLKFINSNITFCASSKNFQWFNTTELVPIQQVELRHEIKSHCAEIDLGKANCVCEPVRLDMVAGKPPTFSVGVNCSNRQLKQLPANLPPNTIELNVTFNNITSLKLLADDPSYEHLRQLYADNNKIQSIVELEGTKFMDNFIVLSLRHNKLKTIPTYILSDSFDRNWSPRYVYLANNYLNCDCTTARLTKLWLGSNINNIPDYEQVMCENVPVACVNLPESKVCPQLKDWTDYIYYVITIEIILLFGLVTKVSYDYWVYKTAGYLPWPASEMPKLPCDWLCE